MRQALAIEDLALDQPFQNSQLDVGSTAPIAGIAVSGKAPEFKGRNRGAAFKFDM